MGLVKKISILGGGTSAWLTAAYLSKNLPKNYFELYIIKGKSDKSIGVGESTLPDFSKFIEECGFSKQQWYDFCECTEKAGVGYKDWINKNSFQWHPFGAIPHFNKDNKIYNIFDLFFSSNLPKSDFIKYINDYKQCVIKNQPPKSNQGVHINSGKLSEFIKNNIKINIINEDIIDIDFNQKDISNLLLSSNQYHKSDLYINCLGFDNILSKKQQKIFIDKSNSTPNNAAIFNPASYNSKQSLKTPYTVAQCTPYGWIWKTPLQSRIGSGMVFNKDISNKDEVITWYENYWGKDNLLNQNTKYIEYKSGYYSNQWEGNVVDIGLSSGFIEPLESTGIQFIIEGVRTIHYLIKKGWVSSENKTVYNLKLNELYSDTFDFISIHYLNNNHNTPFWNYSKTHITKNISKSLKLRIDVANTIPYNPSFHNPTSIFSDHSWYYTLIQFANLVPSIQNLPSNIDPIKYLKDLQEHYN